MKLGPTSRSGDQYSKWVRRYEKELNQSREDFVDHHRAKYGGVLPVWEMGTQLQVRTMV